MITISKEEQLDALVERTLEHKTRFKLTTKNGIGDYIREQAIPEILDMIGQISGIHPFELAMAQMMTHTDTSQLKYASTILLLFYDATLTCIAHPKFYQENNIRNPIDKFKLEDGRYAPVVYIEKIKKEMKKYQSTAEKPVEAIPANIDKPHV
jgi:hypothetical protein